jgi:hypothetical protein
MTSEVRGPSDCWTVLSKMPVSLDKSIMPASVSVRRLPAVVTALMPLTRHGVLTGGGGGNG